MRVNALQFYTSAHISNPSRFGQNIKNKKCFNDRQIIDVRRERPIVKTFRVTTHEEVSIILKRKIYSYSGDASKKVVWLRVMLLMKETDTYRWIEGRYDC